MNGYFVEPFLVPQAVVVVRFYPQLQYITTIGAFSNIWCDILWTR